MLDPKVAEDAYHAWENFMRHVCRMQRSMLTEMAEKIDQQWADMVAETPKERHDEATCCGARQVADVGEGWRWLRPDEILREGDEYCSLIHCCFYATGDYGLPANHEGGAGPYRRRVTPATPAPELSPAAVSAMCQRNERAALLKKIDTLKAESDQQQEIILHAGLEVERLTAEVERLKAVPPAPQSRPAETRATTRAEQPLGAYLDEENNELREQVVTLTAEVERLKAVPPAPQFPKAEAVASRRKDAAIAMLTAEVKSFGDVRAAYATEIARLRSEVERLRLRPEEIRAVKDSIREYEDTYDVILHQNAVALRDMLKRRGGGE